MTSSRYAGSYAFVDDDADERELKSITEQLQKNRTLSNNSLIKALKVRRNPRALDAYAAHCTVASVDTIVAQSTRAEETSVYVRCA